MSDCKNYVSEEDIKALKESELHIEHVARSRNLAGEKALSVTDTIRGEKVTNRTLDGLEELYQNALSDIGYQQMGDYKPGITIDGRNQIVFENGSWYIYRGDLPHVTTGATLTEDGGIWSEENPNGQWVNIGVSLEKSIFDTGGELKKNELVFHKGFYFKSNEDISINPSSEPGDYALTNMGKMLYTPDDNILNFNDDLYTALGLADEAYGSITLNESIYDIRKPYFSKSNVFKIKGDNSTINWIGEPTIGDSPDSRTGLLDVSEISNSYIVRGVYFKSDLKLNDPYINVLNGVYDIKNCQFDNSKYCAFKSSSRVSNGTQSIDGAVVFSNNIVNTDNGPFAYGKGSSWYKQDNKTKMVVSDNIINTSGFNLVSSGISVTTIHDNVFKDPSAFFYNIPVYYLETDDNWKLENLTVEKNIVSGEGRMTFQSEILKGAPCDLYIQSVSEGLTVKVNGLILEKNKHGVYFSSVKNLNSLEIDINGAVDFRQIAILKNDSENKQFVGYCNRYVNERNSYYNLLRGPTAGIDCRNISILENYILGCKFPISVDTVSYGDSESTFKHNITNSIVSDNIMEFSREHLWFTGSCGTIKNNRFNTCGYFSNRESGILINTDKAGVSDLTGVIVESNYFTNHQGRLLQVTSGFCLVGENYHDTIYTLRNQIYSCVDNAVLKFYKEQTINIVEDAITLNNGFKNYIINSDVTISLPSLKYGRSDFSDFYIYTKPEVNITVKGLSGSSSINGSLTLSLTGKRIYHLFNTGSNEFVCD